MVRQEFGLSIHPNSFTQGTGSGITLFAVLLMAVDFQITIDGSNSTNLSYMYNVSIYDKQNLNPGPHVLELTLLNATGSNADHLDRSCIYVDYAVINETSLYIPPPPVGSTARSR